MTLYGVIPAAGVGKRMRPLTENMPKPLLPVLNKSIIEHTIDCLRSVGIEEIVVVLGYRGEKIKERLKGTDVKFVEQKNLDGTVSAIKLAERYVNGDFVIMWGDNFFKGNLDDIVKLHFKRGTKISVMLDKKTKRGAKAFIEQGKIKHVMERPKIEGGYGFAGVYVFDPSVLDLIEEVRKAETGESEMADLLQLAIDKGESLNYVWLKGWRMNMTTPSDLLKANINMIKREGKNFFIGEKCNVRGEIESGVIGNKVSVDVGSRINNSLIMDRATIEKRINIKNSIIRWGGIVKSDCIGLSPKKPLVF